MGSTFTFGQLQKTCSLRSTWRGTRKLSTYFPLLGQFVLKKQRVQLYKSMSQCMCAVPRAHETFVCLGWKTTKIRNELYGEEPSCSWSQTSLTLWTQTSLPHSKESYLYGAPAESSSCPPCLFDLYIWRLTYRLGIGSANLLPSCFWQYSCAFLVSSMRATNPANPL